MGAQTRARRLLVVVGMKPSDVRRALLLFTLAVTATLLAQGTSALVIASIAAGAVPLGLAIEAEPPPPSPADIMASPLFRALPPETPTPEPTPDDACDPGIRLVAVIASERQERSYAALRGTFGTRSLAVGERVEEREVIAIERERVVLRSEQGSVCRLAMWTRPETREATATPSAPASSPGHVQVSRAWVERLTADRAALMHLARIVPFEQDGQLVGVRLYGIRRASPLAELGLQNGDLVRRVNGMEVSDPTVALTLYSSIGQTQAVTVELERRGSPITLTVSID